MTRPVGSVLSPSQAASDRDVAVLEIEEIHDLGDGEVALCDFDLPILAALLESVHDKSAVITATAWCNCAKSSGLVHSSEGRG